jgi:hypothetical protein
MHVETLLLGSNRITNCDAALEIEGEEVFRLRERRDDGQLVVDFDLRDASGNRIATIVKSHVVQAAEPFDAENRPGLYSVVHRVSRAPYATVQEVSRGVVKVTGTFNVNGLQVAITDETMTMGGMTLVGNSISGFDTAIELRKGAFAIGVKRRR